MKRSKFPVGCAIILYETMSLNDVAKILNTYKSRIKYHLTMCGVKRRTLGWIKGRKRMGMRGRARTIISEIDIREQENKITRNRMCLSCLIKQEIEIGFFTCEPCRRMNRELE